MTFLWLVRGEDGETLSLVELLIFSGLWGRIGLGGLAGFANKESSI